jgi:hypothetical protein
VASVDDAHESEAETLAELARELLSRAAAPQVEVSTGAGIVYALRQGDWSLAVVAGRFALSSLVFFDMRRVIEEIG